MKKTLLYSLTAAIALSTTLVASSPDVSAASYKVSKGKLVYAKSGKVVKGKVVYKHKLYNNGKLAKGTILYKKTLYVNGKIDSEIVKYNGNFYSKGKAISTSKVFLYGDKLYQGNQVYPGYKSYDDQLYKDGKPFTGIYKNKLYDYGQVNFGSLEDNLSPVFSTADGTSMTYILSINFDKTFNINASDVTISDGAIIKSFNIVKSDNGDYPYAVIQIENTQLNHTYKLTINNFTIGNYGALNLSSDIKSLDSSTQNNKTYKSALATYLKYNAYTDEQLQKMTSKEYYTLQDALDNYDYSTYDIENEDTVGAIQGLIQATYNIMQKSPYFGEN